MARSPKSMPDAPQQVGERAPVQAQPHVADHRGHLRSARQPISHLPRRGASRTQKPTTCSRHRLACLLRRVLDFRPRPLGLRERHCSTSERVSPASTSDESTPGPRPGHGGPQIQSARSDSRSSKPPTRRTTSVRSTTPHGAPIALIRSSSRRRSGASALGMIWTGSRRPSSLMVRAYASTAPMGGRRPPRSAGSGATRGRRRRGRRSTPPVPAPARGRARARRRATIVADDQQARSSIPASSSGWRRASRRPPRAPPGGSPLPERRAQAAVQHGRAVARGMTTVTSGGRPSGRRPRGAARAPRPSPPPRRRHRATVHEWRGRKTPLSPPRPTTASS